MSIFQKDGQQHSFMQLVITRLIVNRPCRLPKDALDSSLVYTKNRDIHSVGIVFLQMLISLDVMDRFPDYHTALRNCE